MQIRLGISNSVSLYKDNIIKYYIRFLSDRTLFEIIIIVYIYIYTYQHIYIYHINIIYKYMAFNFTDAQ